MTRAIELAWRGWGRVQPNPLVGAVILAQGELGGEGWHAEFGDLHAETAALAQAGDRARGATMVVSLEPCAHAGKQPPCTDALLRAGVRRVVVALADPDPVAAGGVQLLRAAGVEVEVGVLDEQAAAQNAIFLHCHRDRSRPFVALKLATTLDGRIADASGRSQWISGPPARDYIQWLRAGFDAIAIGGATARTDNPSLTARGPVAPRVPPRRIVFSRDGDLPHDLTVVQTARDIPTLMVATSDLPGDRLAALEGSGVGVISATDLASALVELRARKVGSILVEGGGRLAGSLLAAGLVDRYYWIQSPLWLGEDAVPAVGGLPAIPLGQAERWRVVERRTLGEDTLLVADRR